MATTAARRSDTRRESRPVGHQHRDVNGGWLRPSVFGVMDGLVTNVSLIAGVGGSGASNHTIILTGLAGLVAGAFSMATGEYTSVRSQNELVRAEVEVERLELKNNPEAEQRELADVLAARGLDRRLADEVAAQLSANPDAALRVHAQEELGIDPKELPSPYVAAGSSFLSFAVGALVPLLPYLAGARLLWVSLAAAAVTLLLAGAVVGWLTDRPLVQGAVRQLLLGALAAGVTYAVGHAIGANVS